MAIKVGRGKQNANPWCQQPTDCRALGDGLCRSCIMRKHHNDPEFRVVRNTNIGLAHAALRAMPPEKRAARSKALSERMKVLAATPEFKRARHAANKAALADPEKRAVRMAGFLAHSHSEEHKAQARQHIKKLNNPASRAKGRATRLKKGLEIPRSKQRKIAMEVRDTEDSYQEIGRRHDISGRYVQLLADKFSTARPRTRAGRKPKPPA